MSAWYSLCVIGWVKIEGSKVGPSPSPRISPFWTFIATKAPGRPKESSAPSPVACRPRVDRQPDVVAGLRPGCCASWPVGLPSASTWTRSVPGLAAQEAVVLVLDPGLADLVARVKARVARLLELLGGDLADVAEQVGGDRALRGSRG